jgi:hypothetical protein
MDFGESDRPACAWGAHREGVRPEWAITAAIAWSAHPVHTLADWERDHCSRKSANEEKAAKS